MMVAQKNPCPKKSCIVSDFIEKNDFIEKLPTAQNIIAVINHHHYKTYLTRPSDPATDLVKDEILKRLIIRVSTRRRRVCKLTLREKQSRWREREGT